MGLQWEDDIPSIDALTDMEDHLLTHLQQYKPSFHGAIGFILKLDHHVARLFNRKKI